MANAKAPYHRHTATTVITKGNSASACTKLVQRTAFTNAKGAFVVCDIANATSRDRIPYWIAALWRESGEIPIVLIGNKLDLVEPDGPEVTAINDIGRLRGVSTFLTSAREGPEIGRAHP